MKIYKVACNMMGVCQRNEYSLNKSSVSGTRKCTPRWCACCLIQRHSFSRRVTSPLHEHFFGCRPSSWLSTSRLPWSTKPLLALQDSSDAGSTILTAVGAVEVGCTRDPLRPYTMLQSLPEETLQLPAHMHNYDRQTLSQTVAMDLPLPGYLHLCYCTSWR